MFSKNLLLKANSTFSVTKDTEKSYAQKGKGEMNEKLVYELCQYLDGVQNVWMSATGSCLDTALKIDVVLELEDGTCLGIQVKSSQAGASKHTALGQVTFDGKQYPVPEVVIVTTPLATLKELERVTKLSLKSEVIEAIKLAEQVKGMQLPAAAFKGTVKRTLIDLGLAKSKGDLSNSKRASALFPL